jgi:hypothetical protein
MLLSLHKLGPNYMCQRTRIAPIMLSCSIFDISMEEPSLVRTQPQLAISLSFNQSSIWEACSYVLLSQPYQCGGEPRLGIFDEFRQDIKHLGALLNIRVTIVHGSSLLFQLCVLTDSYLTGTQDHYLFHFLESPCTPCSAAAPNERTFMGAPEHRKPRFQ